MLNNTQIIPVLNHLRDKMLEITELILKRNKIHFSVTTLLVISKVHGNEKNSD